MTVLTNKSMQYYVTRITISKILNTEKMFTPTVQELICSLMFSIVDLTNRLMVIKFKV